MKLLALTINSTPILAPGGVPTGGAISFNIILQAFITLLFVVGVLMALSYLVWGGMSWTLSGGDKQKVQTARNKIIYSIIGLIVIFLAYLIINSIGKLFGVKL